MLNMSVKGKYGLAVMVALAHVYIHSVQMRVLASTQRIPQNYLEHILAELKREGFVKSIRGCSGGYFLAKSPSQISVKDILTCLEGDLSLVDHTKKASELTFYWKKVEEVLKTMFDQSLQELVEEKQIHQQRQKKMVTYSI